MRIYLYVYIGGARSNSWPWPSHDRRLLRTAHLDKRSAFDSRNFAFRMVVASVFRSPSVLPFWRYARSIMFPAVRSGVLANTPFQHLCFPFCGPR